VLSVTQIIPYSIRQSAHLSALMLRHKEQATFYCCR